MLYDLTTRIEDPLAPPGLQLRKSESLDAEEFQGTKQSRGTIFHIVTFIHIPRRND
jgi:hypothetical protein